jgi:multidrug transporter EmrE-like cation transporter
MKEQHTDVDHPSVFHVSIIGILSMHWFPRPVNVFLVNSRFAADYKYSERHVSPSSCVQGFVAVWLAFFAHGVHCRVLTCPTSYALWTAFTH